MLDKRRNAALAEAPNLANSSNWYWVNLRAYMDLGHEFAFLLTKTREYICRILIWSSLSDLNDKLYSTLTPNRGLRILCRLSNPDHRLESHCIPLSPVRSVGEGFLASVREPSTIYLPGTSMIIVYMFQFPAGVVVIRLRSSTSLERHWKIQAVSVISKTLPTAHQRFGLVLVSGIQAQGVLGWVHINFVKWQRRTVTSQRWWCFYLFFARRIDNYIHTRSNRHCLKTVQWWFYTVIVDQLFCFKNPDGKIRGLTCYLVHYGLDYR